MSEQENTTDWLADEIRKAEDEARRIAKRDGVPSEWIETVLTKLRGDGSSRA